MVRFLAWRVQASFAGARSYPGAPHVPETLSVKFILVCLDIHGEPVCLFSLELGLRLSLSLLFNFR